MLLTISTTHRPATDLGYLLAKHPERVHSFEITSGRAHVFWPEVSEERATAALLVELDSTGLVRSGSADEDAPLSQYVNDRPYAASSFLSVAMTRVFASAMAGRSRERQALAETALPLVATAHAVPCRGGEALVRRLFEPLGYAVTVTRIPDAPHFDVTIAATVRLAELLGHLYVLVPVLDDGKHYWVGDDEVDKLVDRGEGWLEHHPERELVVRRYLKHRTPLVRSALERLVPEEAEDTEAPRVGEEDALEARISLNEQRIAVVLGALKASGARSVADLGCGEGRLLLRLLKEPQFERVLGVDVSVRSLERAKRRLGPERLPERVAARLELLQGSITYRDKRLEDLDAAALVEVIEHVEPDRLPAVEHAVFRAAKPRTVLVTTPNAEFNVRFELPGFRHRDHRFEWTRAEFEGWSRAVAERTGYEVRFEPIGAIDPELGPPTQMAVFTRLDRARSGEHRREAP